MKTKHIFIILLVLQNLSTNAQQSTATSSQRVLSVELYRGIVEVFISKEKQVKWHHQVYDYDHFDETGELIEFEDSYFSNSEIGVEKEVDTIKLVNEASRELHYLKIQVPEHLKLKVDINHYGEIRIDQILEEAELQVFNGKIEVKQSRSSVSAAVVRHGDISVESLAKSNDISVAMSTYRGNIVFRSSSNNMSIIMKTDLGEIENKLGATLEKGRAVQFQQKENNESVSKKAFWYRGKLGNGNGPSILLANTFGKIILEKI